jgi:hypothetical protein
MMHSVLTHDNGMER